LLHPKAELLLKNYKKNQFWAENSEIWKDDAKFCGYAKTDMHSLKSLN
jgi:hypothetical protein